MSALDVLTCLVYFIFSQYTWAKLVFSSTFSFEFFGLTVNLETFDNSCSIFHYLRYQNAIPFVPLTQLTFTLVLFFFSR